LACLASPRLASPPVQHLLQLSKAASRIASAARTRNSVQRPRRGYEYKKSCNTNELLNQTSSTPTDQPILDIDFSRGAVPLWVLLVPIGCNARVSRRRPRREPGDRPSLIWRRFYSWGTLILTTHPSSIHSFIHPFILSFIDAVNPKAANSYFSEPEQRTSAEVAKGLRNEDEDKHEGDAIIDLIKERAGLIGLIGFNYNPRPLNRCEERMANFSFVFMFH